MKYTQLLVYSVALYIGVLSPTYAPPVFSVNITTSGQGNLWVAFCTLSKTGVIRKAGKIEWIPGASRGITYSNGFSELIDDNELRVAQQAVLLVAQNKETLNNFLQNAVRKIKPSKKTLPIDVGVSQPVEIKRNCSGSITFSIPWQSLNITYVDERKCVKTVKPSSEKTAEQEKESVEKSGSSFSTRARKALTSTKESIQKRFGKKESAMTTTL